MQEKRCGLYRMRVGHLQALARQLDEAGYAATVTEPEGMPVLRVRRPGMADLDVVATIGGDWSDWFRYRDGDEITRCDRVADAADAVAVQLRRPLVEGARS